MNEEKNSQKEPQLNAYIKYTAIAFQMGAVIGGGVLLGRWLDGKVESQTPWFTIGIGLFSIFAALYLSLKNLLKNK